MVRLGPRGFVVVEWRLNDRYLSGEDKIMVDEGCEVYFIINAQFGVSIKEQQCFKKRSV